MYDNERDKEILQAPYKKLAKTEELVNSNALLDLYVTLYKKKFKGEPIFPVSNEHISAMKSFGKAAGHKAYYLLEHFFEMKDDWFIKQAYSIGCLMNNMNKVNASYSQLNATHKVSGKINLQTFCDCCWKDMVRQVSANHNYDEPNRCEECIRNNTPLKRVTKEERKEAILKIGAAFPDIPASVTEEYKDELLKKLK